MEIKYKFIAFFFTLTILTHYMLYCFDKKIYFQEKNHWNIWLSYSGTKHKSRDVSESLTLHYRRKESLYFYVVMEVKELCFTKADNSIDMHESRIF